LKGQEWDVVLIQKGSGFTTVEMHSITKQTPQKTESGMARFDPVPPNHGANNGAIRPGIGTIPTSDCAFEIGLASQNPGLSLPHQLAIPLDSIELRQFDDLSALVKVLHNVAKRTDRDLSQCDVSLDETRHDPQIPMEPEESAGNRLRRLLLVAFLRGVQSACTHVTFDATLALDTRDEVPIGHAMSL
jgi:hypothetical protein